MFKYAASLYLVNFDKFGNALRTLVGQASWQWIFCSPNPPNTLNQIWTWLALTCSRSYKCLIDNSRCMVHDDPLRLILKLITNVTQVSLKRNDSSQNFVSRVKRLQEMLLAVSAAIHEVTQVLPTGTSFGTSSSK